jgi:hypothetical protein
MSDLSSPTQKLIQRYQNWYQSQQTKTASPTIHVDEVASRVASFYERIRGVVEWKEEHLLRKAAIERILKRRLILPKTGKDVAESFILELIRGGHFPNDTIPESKIAEVEKALDKYLYILENSSGKQEEKLKVELYDWLLGIAACEIEEILCSYSKERAMIDCMTETMKERIHVSGGALSDTERELQIFIACQRALFKFDSPLISYYILRKQYPQWSELPEIQLKEITVNVYSIWENIEQNLNHLLSEKFYKICERYDTLYLILGDVISQDPSQAQKNLQTPETLEVLIKSAYQTRLKRLKARVSRAAFFSTISIFVTKMLLAFAIEVPFDKYVLGKFNYQTIGFNILIPPLLMFMLVLTVRPPRKENLNVVIMELMKIVYKKDVRDIYEIKPARKKGFISTLFVNLFYLITFVVSFGAIIWELNRLNFGALSIVIFLMFFSLIAFAGVKIRERARELDVMERRAGFFAFLMDIFSLPFLRVGRWLSNQWTRYNIVLVLIIALVDMPFQIFVEFLEQWRTFLKEKKEEIH